MAEESKDASKKEKTDEEKSTTSVPPKEDQKNTTDTAVEKKEELEKPKPKEYTPEEIEEIAKRVETYSNQTPKYDPQHVLSPEYEGTSNYEQGIEIVRSELEEKLTRLKQHPEENEREIRRTEEDLKKLDNLYENFHLGMNVFRTAHGGREKLRE